MNLLQKSLNSYLKPAAPKRVDMFRKSRTLAKKLALEYGIELEKYSKEGGYNVWPPKDFVGIDPADGDHYCGDWDEVLEAVQVYVTAVEENKSTLKV